MDSGWFKIEVMKDLIARMGFYGVRSVSVQSKDLIKIQIPEWMKKNIERFEYYSDTSCRNNYVAEINISDPPIF
ncbi:hypothetical protein DERP_011565 [Dermatophagoides pteronyssinus]|uniref:Uncharacterized protein n=1 Tax=Dermatophagoides pteronyssinus TaxID=6956 RepID=A0ABQ8JCA4_DERPT|nr:hypothetical protein DERP_011565 [Dermatophagoides pteronyssinus]